MSSDGLLYYLTFTLWLRPWFSLIELIMQMTHSVS